MFDAIANSLRAGRHARACSDDPVGLISFGTEYLALLPRAQYLENGDDELLCFFKKVVIKTPIFDPANMCMAQVMGTKIGFISYLVTTWTWHVVKFTRRLLRPSMI